jgi:hypothetical protein
MLEIVKNHLKMLKKRKECFEFNSPHFWRFYYVNGENTTARLSL